MLNANNLTPVPANHTQLNSPFIGSFAVVPANNVFAGKGKMIRAVTIGVAGTLSWYDAEGAIQTTNSLAAGTYNILATGIRATGTTATGITAWY